MCVTTISKKDTCVCACVRVFSELREHTTRHLLAWHRVKRLATPSIGEDVEVLQCSCTAGESREKCRAF